MGRGHGLINGRRCPKIQLCPSCGHMRVYHPGGNYVCPVPAEVLNALRVYRATHGKTWKSKLCEDWQTDMMGEDEGVRTLLQQARNMIGPRRLYKINLDRSK